MQLRRVLPLLALVWLAAPPARAQGSFNFDTCEPFFSEEGTAAGPSEMSAAKQTTHAAAAATNAMHATMNTVSATEPAAEAVSAFKPALLPPPLALASSGEAHAFAYRAAYRLLRENNECSRFFGGPETALEVLNSVAARMRAKPLQSRRVAVRMAGEYSIVRNARTGATYRVFDEVTVNSAGPVSRVPRVDARKETIGSFPSFSKEAWVLTLLHELGHLVRGADGKWLLPNDGGDDALSDLNTRTVERQCAKQLAALED